jgi:hypothetical protein
MMMDGWEKKSFAAADRPVEALCGGVCGVELVGRQGLREEHHVRAGRTATRRTPVHDAAAVVAVEVEIAVASSSSG